MNDAQYAIVAARRQGYYSLLWQIPALGVAAQGFLVSASLGDGQNAWLSAFLMLLAAVVGCAVAWLFYKLRLHEIADSELLKEYETANSDKGFAVVHGKRVPGASAFRLWLVLLSAFIVIELGGTVFAGGRALQAPFSEIAHPAHDATIRSVQ